MLEVVFLPAAEADVQGAYGWFEGRREGRGVQFLRHTSGTLLAINPGMDQAALREFRGIRT